MASPVRALLQGSILTGTAALGDGRAALLSLQAVRRGDGTVEAGQTVDAFEVVARSPDLAVLAAAHDCLRWRLRQAGGQVCSQSLMDCSSVHPTDMHVAGTAMALQMPHESYMTKSCCGLACGAGWCQHGGFGQ